MLNFTLCLSLSTLISIIFFLSFSYNFTDYRSAHLILYFDILNSFQVTNELKSIECEKQILLENTASTSGECSKKLGEIGDLLESELQCSVCAELFITPITLNCSHSFCEYCITMWKKKKKDCPICRQVILIVYNNAFTYSLLWQLSQRYGEFRHSTGSGWQCLNVRLPRFMQFPLSYFIAHKVNSIHYIGR